jgi:N-acetyl-alpha-D-glucosaminyl L-malate synthase BshA
MHVIRAGRGRDLPAHERLTFHQVSVPSYPVFEHPPYELAMASRIAEVSERHELDLINVHYAIPHAGSAHLARAMIDRPPRLVTSLHGSDVMVVGRDPSFASFMRHLVRFSDGFTVPSRFLHDRALELLGDVAIETIPNFVDTERFTPSLDKEPILFHVSNFRPVKRVLDLIEVLAIVRRTLPVKLVLVGDGPERARVEQRAKELGLLQHVELLGMRSDFASRLARASVFVLPSELESFGLAALEAMSAGVPVLAYRVGGLAEVVDDGVTGRLVAPYDVEALARAAIELLSSGEKVKRWGEAARQHALGFRTEPALERYERYFERVLDNPRHP